MMNLVTPVELVGMIFVGSILLFSLGWVTGKRLGNYSIVDALWALSFGFFALLILLLSPGYTPRKFLFGGMVLIWSLRLGVFLTARIFSRLDHEDIRHQNLRKKYGKHADFRFLVHYLAQAVLVVLLLAPLLISSENPLPKILPLETAGAALWFIGLIGEAVADAQDPNNKTGLWRILRHPDYFFQGVIWISYGVFALGTPDGWITLYAPLLMIVLLLRRSKA